MTLRLAVAALVLLSAGTGGWDGGSPIDRSLAVDQTLARSELDDVAVAGHDLTYSGTEVTGITVVLNNTGDELTGSARVRLLTKNGTLLEEATNSGLIVPGRNELSVSFEGSYAPSRFAFVRLAAGKSL